MQAERAIARARSALGTRFRLHGRDPAMGLDCVGLIAWAFDREADAPTNYALRNTQILRWEVQLASLGSRRTETLKTGTICLFHIGPAQLHLGLWTGNSLLHAHAGIGRVVETPGPVEWPVASLWHFSDQDI